MMMKAITAFCFASRSQKVRLFSVIPSSAPVARAVEGPRSDARSFATFAINRERIDAAAPGFLARAGHARGNDNGGAVVRKTVGPTQSTAFLLSFSRVAAA